MVKIIFCRRCSIIKDVSTKAYQSSQTNQNNRPNRILANGNIELMTVIQIIVIIGALIGSFVEIRTILLSGPMLSAVGLVVAWTSYRCNKRLGVVVGLSGFLISLFCISLILIFNWLPQEAETPIRIIGLIYSFLVLPLGITILLHLNRRNPNGTFSLKTEKN
ncbi:MAG: hypothetical protein IPK14_24750 [Blastocatellia bacterium]|nr:hypothetical protein [Blastocatellia bacterium]